MEYVTGGDLHDLLKAGQLPIERCLRLALDLADALTRAHKLDIIHRDLKPANVLLAEDGTLRLSDFGVARIGQKERVTATDMIVGTIDYLAPEALDGAGIDPRADIWAFGVMLFEMVGGKRPFSGESLTATLTAILTQPVPDLESLRPDAPVALIDLIYRMLEKERDARIRTVRHVGAELEDILSGHSDRTPPEPRFAPLTPDFLQRPKHNLPAQTTPFVGREAELTELAKLLDHSKIRLITIVAQGGMGKTRLALELAEQALTPDTSSKGRGETTEFENGVYFVELAPLSDAANIVSAIAEAVSYQFQADGRDQKQQILDFLGSKNLLLVMDNYEHLLEGATLVTDILKAAPHVKILATSRQRLNQSGETLFNLEGMDFPAWETPSDALEYAAVKLFIQSAKRAKPDFEITADNMDAIARICKLVQGLPLGIVLAAAWLSMLSPDEIATEIAKSIDFLSSDMSDVPARQRSMRAVFDYSWDLMSEDEKQVFMKLSVFRGGFTREAAEAVAGANLRVLMSLMNKSLIRRDADSGRYQIHELLRQYAEQRLEITSTADETRLKHSDYYIDFLIRHESNIKGQRQLNAKYIHLEQAVESLTNAAEMNHTLHEALFLLEYFVNSSAASDIQQHTVIAWEGIYLRYARTRLITTSEFDAEVVESILRHSRKQSDLENTAYALWILGDYAAITQDYTTQLTRYEESITIFRSLNNEFYLAHTLLGTFNAYLVYSQFEKMWRCLNESVAIRRRIGDRHGLCLSLYTLGAIKAIVSQLEEAELHIDEALAFEKEIDTASVFVASYGVKALLRGLNGDFEAASGYTIKGLNLAQKQNYLGDRSICLLVLGFVESVRESYNEALKLCIEAKNMNFLPLTAVLAEWGLALANCGLHQDDISRHSLLFIFSARQAPLLQLISVPIMTVLLARSNHLVKAVELLGFSLNQSKSATAWLEQWSLLHQVRGQLQKELSQQTYEDAWERGKSLDLDTVVQELLNEFEDNA
jgi:predicted ATPase